MENHDKNDFQLQTKSFEGSIPSKGHKRYRGQKDPRFLIWKDFPWWRKSFKIRGIKIHDKKILFDKDIKKIFQKISKTKIFVVLDRSKDSSSEESSGTLRIASHAVRESLKDSTDAISFASRALHESLKIRWMQFHLHCARSRAHADVLFAILANHLFYCNSCELQLARI